MSEEQSSRWSAHAERLGFSTPAEWARVMLLQASREGFDGATDDGDQIGGSMLTVHLTEGEHAELEREDFSMWARIVLDSASAQED